MKLNASKDWFESRIPHDDCDIGVGCFAPAVSKGENAVRLAAKLYEARDYIRLMMTPQEYTKRIAEYQGYIRRAMAKWKLSEIEAVMKIAGAIEGRAGETRIVHACLFAAYVDMVEPQNAEVNDK